MVHGIISLDVILIVVAVFGVLVLELSYRKDQINLVTVSFRFFRVILKGRNLEVSGRHMENRFMLLL